VEVEFEEYCIPGEKLHRFFYILNGLLTNIRQKQGLCLLYLGNSDFSYHLAPFSASIPCA